MSTASPRDVTRAVLATRLLSAVRHRTGRAVNRVKICHPGAHLCLFGELTVVGRLWFRRQRLRQTIDICVVTAQLPSANIGPTFEDAGVDPIPRTASKPMPAQIFPVDLDGRRARTVDEGQTLVWMFARLAIDQKSATSALSGFWCACNGKCAHVAVRECDFCRACCANTWVRGRRRCAVLIVLVLRT